MRQEQVQVAKEMILRRADRFTRDALDAVFVAIPDATSQDARVLLAAYHTEALVTALMSFQNEGLTHTVEDLREKLLDKLALLHSLKTSTTKH